MPLRVTDLRCESLADPIGLDVAAPRLGWRLESDGPDVRQAAYRVVVGRQPDAADVWDSGRVVSDQSVHVPYAGPALESATRVHWRVTVETAAGEAAAAGPAFWETGLLRPADFVARWINRGRDHVSWTAPVLPAPLLRRTFTLPQGVISARAYVCGLGYHELCINGQRVGDRVLQPVVSQYDRRVRYVTHDVTSLLRRGPNAIGVMLGNGWYNSHTADVWHFDKAPWRDHPKLWLQLHVRLGSGEVLDVTTDARWKVTDGPVTFDGLRNGETYDARRAISGWAEADFDDRAWPHAVVVPGPGGVLASQWGPACHVAQTLRPVGVTPLSPGVTLFDFGQNVAGWARVHARGAAGRTLTLRHAEQLNDAGDIDTEAIGRFVKKGEFQTDRFIPASDDAAVWEPRFTYHGFRYVRATWDCASDDGASAPPPPDVDARVVETELPAAGDLACSDETVNRIHRAACRSFRGNFTGIPTDCPHREKNGWTGDAHLAAETGLLNFCVGPAYRAWIESVADAQRPSGQLPGIVPTGGWGFNWGSGPAWDAALLLIPWYTLLYTGDDAMIGQHYAAMRNYVRFCGTLASDHLVHFGLGDWCHVDKARIAPVALTSTSYYYVCVRLLARFAALLGHASDTHVYAGLADDIRGAFNAAFYHGDGVYGDGGVTAQACALYQGEELGYPLVEAAERPRVVGRLVDAVNAAGVKPDFGILGAKWVPRALADNGHADLAYRLLTQRAFPGWAHWIEQGATTLYETWDGRASRNHVMFGDIDAWLFHYVAGLRPDPRRPGFRHALVRPHAVTGLAHFAAWHETPYGRLGSAWRRAGDAIHFEITIPPNSTATVTLPDGRTFDATSGIGRHVLTEAG